MNTDHNRHVQRAPPPPRMKKPRPVLRIHKRAFILLAFYITIILVPWILTAMLSNRPLTESSWTYGPGISYKDYKKLRGWARAIPILNAVAAILVIPIISAIIAQASVVYAQRRYAGQNLSVRQLFSLADRSWMHPWTIRNMLWWNEPGHARVNWSLIACTGLVVLGAVQFPLYQILAPWKAVTMATCKDTQYIDYGFGRISCDFDSFEFSELRYTQVGIDLEPAQMAVIPQHLILPRMRSDLATLNEYQDQPYLWKRTTSIYREAFDLDEHFTFVAALPSKTTTGVLREHIMRLNSTASCLDIDKSEFPTTCAGENPFQTSYEYKEAYYWGSAGNISTIDICAPGNLGKHPWTVSRNRQDLTEEVFLKFTGGYDDGAIHCTGQTTRGYFELGNIHNENVYGELLDKWPRSGPSPEQYQFHDYMRYDWGSDSSRRLDDGYIPSEEDNARGGARPVPDPRTRPDYDVDDWPAETFTNMSGPLMTSVLAFFGNNSWVDGLANLTSQRDEDKSTLATTYSDRPALLGPLCDARPFGQFKGFSGLGTTYNHADCAESLLDLMTTYTDFLGGWTRNSTAANRLGTAMFLANQVAVTAHSTGILPWSRDTGREIFTAPGVQMWKPSVSLPSLIILSTIVGVQIISLLWLGWLIFKWPTWTRTLDAMAIARVAAVMDTSLLPPFRTIGSRDWEKLAHVDGLVGVQAQEMAVEHQHAAGVLRDTSDADIEMRALSVASTVGKEPTSEAVSAALATASSVSLGLGAPGLLSRMWEKQRPAQVTEQGAGGV